MNPAIRVLLFGVLVGLGAAGCAPPESRQADARRELVFERLGREIAARQPGAKVLVVGNPYAARPGAEASIRTAEEASVRGLRRGLGKGAESVGVAHPRLRPEAESDPQSVSIPVGASTPLSFLTAMGAWDRLREGNPGATVWVSLIGFPADLADTAAWKDPRGPKWVMFLPDWRILGSTAAVGAAFSEGRLLMAVMSRPGAPPESESMLADREAEFERRHVLVTAETLERVRREWPMLIP
jgi:hypothetical protein